METKVPEDTPKSDLSSITVRLPHGLGHIHPKHLRKEHTFPWLARIWVQPRADDVTLRRHRFHRHHRAYIRLIPDFRADLHMFSLRIHMRGLRYQKSL